MLHLEKQATNEWIERSFRTSNVRLVWENMIDYFQIEAAIDC